MSLLTPWPIRLDSLVIGTNAIGLERVDGLHGLAPARYSSATSDFHAGEIPEWDAYRGAVERRFRIWVAGCDVDGAVTHPSGERGHLEENLKGLFRVLAKKGAPIAYEQDVPTLAGGVEILSGNCTHASAVEVGGSRGLRNFELRLRFPYPYLHAGAAVADNGNTGTFDIDTSASTAPIQDMVITFKNNTDPKLTINEGPWTGQYLQWIGSPGASGVQVHVGNKTVLQLPAGTDVKGGLRRNFADWMTWEAGNAALGATLTGGGTVDLSYFQART